MYDPVMVQPMRDELTGAGITELTTASEVDSVFEDVADDSTALILINSVCGCAAGTARPGLIQSMKHGTLPTAVTTVFAGVDKDAVDQARGKILGYQPSSPSIAIFRGGKLMDFIQRHDIEIRSAEQLATRLTQSYDKYCGAEVNEEVAITDPMADIEITVTEVSEMKTQGTEFRFVDVRSPQEREMACIEGTDLLTEELFEEMMQSWDRDTSIVLHCHTGVRSLEAARFLAMKGDFKNVKSMSGGIAAWSANVDDSIPSY